MGRDAFGSLDYNAILEQFAVNALGPLRVTEALADNLHEGSKVTIVTSRMGSIGDNSSGGGYGYRASKTAVNQIGTNLKHELMPHGVAVALLHPGMVATELTGGSGIPPAEAAKGLIERIDALDLQNSGGFWHAEGYDLPMVNVAKADADAKRSPAREAALSATFGRRPAWAVNSRGVSTPRRR